MIVQPSYPQQQPSQSDWSKYDSSRTGNIIKTEFEHKGHILEIYPAKFNFEQSLSLVSKELDTSFINDIYLKYLYQIQFENILEWAKMGLLELAEIRLATLFSELKLEKSVGGMERILQGSTLTGNVMANLPTHTKLFPINFRRDDKKEGMVQQLVRE